MTTTQEIDFSVETLRRVCRHERVRLASGQALRDALHQQLALGFEPDHYRVKWLREGIVRVIAEIRKMAEEFNQAQVNDKASTGDFLDILESAKRTIIARTGYDG